MGEMQNILQKRYKVLEQVISPLSHREQVVFFKYRQNLIQFIDFAMLILANKNVVQPNSLNMFYYVKILDKE